VAVSTGPQSVAVTVYRAPSRQAGEKMQLQWLNGFALISETRRIDLPAGEAEIRLEGVAGGIVPESAIVTGVPQGVTEKNQDAQLLSPAGLLDASLGRRVHLRRTSGATGAVTETDAVIRSGADGAVVLETPAGVEALRCTGLAETLVYDRVPAGLVARPTLSVRVRSERPVAATVSLSYLASGFDWQANYIAELSPDRSRMDLFAWLTLANGDETGFANADTQAVAGQLNRSETGRRAARVEPLTLKCWPGGTTTSDLRSLVPPPPAPPPPPMAMAPDEIVVTGSRMRNANLESSSPVTVVGEEEILGDLRLYRIPEPVTVAARSQKQVGLLNRPGVPIRIVYRHRARGDGITGAVPVVTALNRASDKLGIALPSGQVAFFERIAGRRVMVGQGQTRDLAVGEEVEIELAGSVDVQVREVREREDESGGGEHRLVATNAKDRPVPFEVELPTLVKDIAYASARLGERDGRPLWRVTIPPNSSVTLRYRTRAPR
jgi:hypothetical protein